MTTPHVLQGPRPFAQSMLWDLQRRYFAERGVDAWRQGEVPHYVTSNPRMADSYAQIVLAFLRDRQRLAGADEPAAGPLYICELGAGSGRFAFHFLTRLVRLCEQAGVPVGAFRYVLTDQAQANLRFWREHARFQAFFAAGLLDVAEFDIGRSEEIALQLGKVSIGPGSLARPLVVVANYVFDSIPQDLFYVNAGVCEECLVSLSVDEDPAALDAVQLLERVQCRYERRALAGAAYQEAGLAQVLGGYRQALEDSYVLFPATGLRCLERLRALSRQGVLLLSADKGDHRLEALQGKRPPGLVRHGSFSLSVNYHAVKAYCEWGGGLAMFPEVPHCSVDVGACLMVVGAADHVETRLAYTRHVQEFGPDDFYAVSRHASGSIGDMTVADILAYLRLGCYDGHQLGRFLPQLTALAPESCSGEGQEVTQAVERVWAQYFPLGEEFDLADAIARLFYEMGDFQRALVYLGCSMDIYGVDAGTLANMEVCRWWLGQVGVSTVDARREWPPVRAVAHGRPPFTVRDTANAAIRRAQRTTGQSRSARLVPPAYGIDFVDGGVVRSQYCSLKEFAAATSRRKNLSNPS